MSDNPYSPPVAESRDAARRRPLRYSVMFWVCCLLCFGMLGNAFNGMIQYRYYTSQGIKLPVLIVVEAICVACSGFAMLAAAISWRHQANREGLFWVALSLLVLVPCLIWS